MIETRPFTPEVRPLEHDLDDPHEINDFVTAHREALGWFFPDDTSRDREATVLTLDSEEDKSIAVILDHGADGKKTYTIITDIPPKGEPAPANIVSDETVLTNLQEIYHAQSRREDTQAPLKEARSAAIAFHEATLKVLDAASKQTD